MRGSLKDHQLPSELRPVSSAEYPCEPESYDFEFQQRNQRYPNVDERAYRGSYGQVEKVKETRIGGRRWDILEKWDS